MRPILGLTNSMVNLKLDYMKMYNRYIKNVNISFLLYIYNISKVGEAVVSVSTHDHLLCLDRGSM
jgi:hypothetical protein